MIRALEGAAEVRRRHHFFNWLLSKVGSMLPAQLAICGAWSPTHRALVFDQFNSMLLPEATLAELTGRTSVLLQNVIDEWVRCAASVCCVPVDAVDTAAARPQVDELLASGIRELLVHGVSRPHRADAIETIFVFASRDVAIEQEHLHAMALLGPHLHLTYRRMLSFELSLGPQSPVRPANGPLPPSDVRLLTKRELQILTLIRDGLSNAQIGERLEISPLTAKNHVQGLLRKLGASNRAQAVARALALEMMPGADVQAANIAMQASKSAQEIAGSLPADQPSTLGPRNRRSVGPRVTNRTRGLP
ncbi:MAG: hypothetical protein H7Z19_12600 [Chitinophagaceae bacterium]|nr:hypothetical protein [Rubrivivax sp.]